MDIMKEYKKAINTKCNICNKEILENDIEKNNVIATIVKGNKKRANFVHTTCLFRR